MLFVMFMAGAMAGFLVGNVVGWCQMDNTHRRAKRNGGYQPIDTGKPLCNPPRSLRPTPPGAE